MEVKYFATICFALAIIHTFSVKFFQKIAHRYPEGSPREVFFHFLGEVEVVFGLWAGFFIFYYSSVDGMNEVLKYLESRSYTEPLLVFVLMVLCSTKPIIEFASKIIFLVSQVFPFPAHISFYISTMIIGPLLGSLITEPAAMTVTAIVLLNHFYNQGMSQRLKYATLGLLFVSVSIGGTLTPFAAPPVLMVAAKWGWDLPHMMIHFGWKAILSITLSTAAVTYFFKKDLMAVKLVSTETSRNTTPYWVTGTHLLFLFLIILFHHHIVLFVPIFIFFLGVVSVTQQYHHQMNFKGPLLVSFFLAGLIVLGGMQSWWLQPLLEKMSSLGLYLGAISLTAITDNAAITYLGSQVEGLSDFSKYVLVAGSVVGGGLTVIANAPNPAGYSILNSTFGRDGISAVKLFTNALFPTLVALLIFWML